MANGIWEGMKQAPGLFFGGQNNPGISDQQNEQARKQAMLMAGLQGLMASRSPGGQAAPGTLQILAQMGMTGQQAGQGFRQQAAQQQALQNPALGLSQQQQAMLQALPPEAQQQVLAQLATASGQAPKVVGEGAALVGAGGEEIFRNERGPESELSTGMRDALFILGHDEESLKALSPSEQVQVRQQAHQLMQSMKTPMVNVSNAPAPPSGFRNVFDEKGNLIRQEMIEGGPADRQQTARERATSRAAFTVVDDVQRAKDVIDQYGRAAAGVGALTGFLPETPAHQLRQHIESIKGNIGVDQLLKIKEQGAGLGHVPQRQLEMLASLLGRLDPTMRIPDLHYNLDRIQAIYQNIIDETLSSGNAEDIRLLFSGSFDSGEGGGVEGYDDLVPGGNR